ncbi:MAG: hypothetical protein ACLFVQ_12305 [Chitinispirillaceae bacterium]
MYRVLILSVMSALLLGCGAQKKSEETSRQQVKPVPKFVPTADSSLTAEQVALWKQCNPLLDSLTYFYSDSFKVEDPTAKLRIEDDFFKAQNRICKLAGYPGGFKEYNWVSDCLSNPRNKRILDSLDIRSR